MVLNYKSGAAVGESLLTLKYEGMVSEEVFHCAGNQHLCQCNQLRATGAVLYSFTFNVVIICLCSDLVETCECEQLHAHKLCWESSLQVNERHIF